MNAKLYASLEAHIQVWVDESCESGEWPSLITGDRTVEFMAKAARAVFDACDESQAFALREGFVESK